MINESCNFNFKIFEDYKCDGQLVMRFTDNNKIIIEEEKVSIGNDRNNKNSN